MNPELRKRLQAPTVWCARLLVGFTFIISGWSKAIDPWGFAIKVGEYLSAWQMTVPHEAIVASCIALSCIEFCTGALISTGALRRFSVYTAAAIMAGMLPLTLYIAIYNPVADCGCFGDFFTVSNWLTFFKNVALTALIVYLLLRNTRVQGLYPAPIQWIVITLSQAFPLLIALAGYQVQPLVDFRPYKTGTMMFQGSAEAEPETFTYEKDGIRKDFTLDNLPDSTWTFVEDDITAETSFDGGITVRDSEGNDVGADIVTPDGRQFFLLIPEPGMHYLTVAHYVNSLYDYCMENDIELIAIVGNDSRRLAQWRDWCRPPFDVYTSDPVSLKQIARGPEALVYTENGIIRWKRTLGSMPATGIEGIENLRAPDDGLYHGIAVGIYVLGMILTYILGLSPKILRFFIKRTK